MYDETLLKVVDVVIVIYLGIPSAFVAVGPQNHRRVVAVAFHDRFDKAARNISIVFLLPTA
jgi:hypothetical protein